MFTQRVPLNLAFSEDDFRNTIFEKRKQEAESVRSRHPDRVPVICQRCPKTSAPRIDKKKYLVPGDLTPAQFLFIVRKRLSLSSEKGLFLFVNGVVPSSASTFNQLYEEQKDPDGFLYVMYAEENVFG